MGNRQTKKRILFRANWLVVLLLISNISYSQKAKLSIFLQNGFYYEMPKWEEEKQLIIDANSISDCDSLLGALKPQFLKELKIDTTTKKWKLNVFLSFDYEDRFYSIVKIEKNRDSLSLGYKTFSFFKKSKCWNVREIPELLNIQTAIQYLKSDSFWAFYNQEKTDFPEIDAIKTQFKDSEGILDIDKLGAYLKTKPPALAKYCDY